MNPQILVDPGPALILGDCLAPVLMLRKDDHGDLHGTCPICRDGVTDVSAPVGGPMHVRLFQGTAYGVGVLDPCGHRIGAIEIEATR